jgi:hypothetical protein
MHRSILCALLLFLFAAPAAAQIGWEVVDTMPYTSTGVFPAYPGEPERPITVWAEIGIMRDDNPFRFSDAVDTSRIVQREADTIMRYGGGIRSDQRIVGRQRLLLEARGDYYDYNQSDQLDHFAYSLLGDWRWEIGNQLSGSLGVGRIQRLADPSEVLRPVKEEVVANRAFASAAWQFAPSWRVRGGVEGENAERSRPDLDTVESNSQTVRAGADYVSTLGNTLGVEWRESRGDAPVNDLVDPAGQFVGNEFRERELAAVATYGATAQIRFGGRLGRTERTYTQLTDRDFDGTTWRASVEWLPGNKTILGFETYNAPQSVIDVAAAHVVVRGSAFAASWAATAKLVFTGRIFEERREGVGTPESVVLGLPVRDDTVRGVRLGLGWEPVRRAEVGFGVEWGDRTSNEILRDYDYVAGMINLRVRY